MPITITTRIVNLTRLERDNPDCFETITRADGSTEKRPTAKWWALLYPSNQSPANDTGMECIEIGKSDGCDMCRGTFAWARQTTCENCQAPLTNHDNIAHGNCVEHDKKRYVRIHFYLCAKCATDLREAF